MNQFDALRTFSHWDRQGKFIFTKHELSKIFSQDNPKTLTEALARLVKSGILERVCRSVYLYQLSQHKDGYVIEHIAKALRPGEYSYISLESILSEYGVISQIPIDRLTIMTTGRKAEYTTPYGTIEFIHSKRTISDIVERMLVDKKRPLRIAKLKAAWEDLKRVGRNTHLVDTDELESELCHTHVENQL